MGFLRLVSVRVIRIAIYQGRRNLDPVRCGNVVTPPERTRERLHRGDRGAGHEPHPLRRRRHWRTWRVGRRER